MACSISSMTTRRFRRAGHFTVNGVPQAAGTTFSVNAAQLAQTTFTAGSLSSDDLFVNVYDGSGF